MERDERGTYDTANIMVTSLSRYIGDGMLVHVGTATFLGLVAAVLAKATHAPRADFRAMSGTGYYSEPFVVTLSLAEAMSLTIGPAERVTDAYTHVERDEGVDFEASVPAQIDMYGNANLSIIGTDYDRPKVRLPGSAGLDSLPLMRHSKLRFYSTRHNTRTFVPKVDFITGAGYLTGPGAREALGIRGDGGPGSVVTNLGVFDWDEATKRMRVVSLHPGVTSEQVRSNTGFEILGLDGRPPTTPLPTAEQLDVIARIDPLGIRRLEFLEGSERRRVLREVLDAEARIALGRPNDAFRALAFRKS